MSLAVEALAARLRDLALVEVDVLVGGLDGPAAVELVGAYVADLEDALAQARALVRDAHAALGAGPDPLALVDRTPGVRAAGGEDAVVQAGERLGERARARRELAALEELVRVVLPRLLEADRRLSALA